MTTETPGQPASSAPSLRDSLSDAFDAAPAADTSNVPANDAPADASSVPATDSTPDSRLAPAGEADDASAPSSTQPPAAADGQPASGVPAKQAAGDAPKTPPGFPGGDAAWNALPAEARNWAKGRERQFETYIRTNAEAAKFGGAMWNAVRPYEAMIRAQGAHPAAVVQGALNQHFALAQGSPEQKAGVILGLAQHYGVDLSSAIDAQAQAPQQSPEVMQLRQALGGVVGYLRQNEMRQAQQETMAATGHVNQFASDPQRPHMNDQRVTQLMADLIESGRAQGLQDAYESAVYAFPDIRAVLLEQDAARRAANARSAQQSAPARGGAPVASVMSPTNQSIRSQIERAWDDTSGRRVA